MFLASSSHPVLSISSSAALPVRGRTFASDGVHHKHVPAEARQSCTRPCTARLVEYTVARHAETVPVRLRNAMIMFTQVGLQRSRRLWPECTAHVEIVGTVLRPSQESRPVVCAQRYRSALPLGKALCGCAAPLLPPLRTAVQQCTGRRTQAAGEAALRVRVMLPAHWSL